MDRRPIGMFDSGVGGLTVLKEVRKALPNEEIIYLGDTKNFPYGSKTKESIVEISKRCVEFLIKKNVKAIVIACGTATSQSLDVLQNIYDIPIIGIIEPTVKYIKESKIREFERIGVIATSGTIRSGAWEDRLRKEINNIDVVNVKAPLLATMAEEGWTNNKVAEYTIKEYMQCFKNIDRLILGCTHYPLFEELIRRELHDDTEIINTGTIVSKYLKNYIDENKIESDSELKDYKIYVTDLDNSFKDVADKLLGEGQNLKVYKAEI